MAVGAQHDEILRAGRPTVAGGDDVVRLEVLGRPAFDAGAVTFQNLLFDARRPGFVPRSIRRGTHWVARAPGALRNPAPTNRAEALRHYNQPKTAGGGSGGAVIAS